MKTKDLIGKTITDIFVYTELVDGWLEHADVTLELDNSQTVRIPWDFRSENLEKIPDFHSKSLFQELSDFPVHWVNPQKKTEAEIEEIRNRQKHSFWGRLQKLFGKTNFTPKEFWKPYKITYRENPLKHLQNQKIVDFLMVEGSDSCGFLELENGYLITETIMAPLGTGTAGLTWYENQDILSDSIGEHFVRLSENQD